MHGRRTFKLQVPDLEEFLPFQFHEAAAPSIEFLEKSNHYLPVHWLVNFLLFL